MRFRLQTNAPSPCSADRRGDPHRRDRV